MLLSKKKPADWPISRTSGGIQLITKTWWVFLRSLPELYIDSRRRRTEGRYGEMTRAGEKRINGNTAVLRHEK